VFTLVLHLVLISLVAVPLLVFLHRRNARAYADKEMQREVTIWNGIAVIGAALLLAVLSSAYVGIGRLVPSVSARLTTALTEHLGTDTLRIDIDSTAWANIDSLTQRGGRGLEGAEARLPGGAMTRWLLQRRLRSLRRLQDRGGKVLQRLREHDGKISIAELFGTSGDFVRRRVQSRLTFVALLVCIALAVYILIMSKRSPKREQNVFIRDDSSHQTKGDADD
jgi:hypothetical protein